MFPFILRREAEVEMPQMTLCGFCVLGIPLQGIQFDATLVQIHERAYFKWHRSLGEMLKIADGGHKNELKG